AAERDAIVVLDEVTAPAHFVEGSCVQCVIAQELVHGSVEFTCARMRNNIDLAAARTAEFRGIATCLNLKLLNRIRRKADVLRVEGGICIGCAVNEEVVRVRAVSPDGERGTLSRPPVERIHVAGLRSVSGVRAWHSEREVY